MAGLHEHLADLRANYSRHELNEESIDHDPFKQFHIWFAEAEKAEIKEPNTMALATASLDAAPSVRIVLLKGLDQDGFVFFTNYRSQKAHEIAENPQAAISFLWLELERQVRVEGMIHKISNEESDAYFAIRPKGSQIGAWASPQSMPISKTELMQNMQEQEARFANDEIIPRPEHWGGYRLIPSMIEFWQGRPNRLHDRIVYHRSVSGWTIERLAP